MWGEQISNGDDFQVREVRPLIQSSRLVRFDCSHWIRGIRRAKLFMARK